MHKNLIKTKAGRFAALPNVATSINTQIIRILNIIIARVMNTKYTQVLGMIIELVVKIYIYTTSINNNYKLSNIL